MHTATLRVPPLAKATGKKQTPDFGLQCTRQKNRRRLTACGVQVGAPHELFARPPSPLFHLYTLAPMYLRPESGRSRKIPLLDLSRT